MTGQLELAYLGLEVPDPASLTPFFAEVVGLLAGDPGPDGALTWRNDDRVHRLVVEPGPANDGTAFGFEAVDDAALDATARRLEAAGFAVQDGTDEQRRARRVERLVHTETPWGGRLELVRDLEVAPELFASPLVPGGFHTGGVGFGHAVVATTEFEESLRFLTDGLGMVQSDWMETEIAEGVELEARFLHCNARHHTLALVRAPFALPAVLHHLMVETNRQDDVGAAFDRAWASGLDIPNGLGRHDNDRMFSFYVTSPAGFLVEVGHGAREITADWDDDRRYDRTSVWGHRPLRPPEPILAEQETAP